MTRFIALLMLCLTAACASTPSETPQYTEVVPIMPRISAEMQTAGYWIARTSSPDASIMTSEEIAAFNSNTISAYGLLTTSSRQETLSGKAIKDSILTLHNAINNQKLYNTDGRGVSEDELANILANYDIKELDRPNFSVRLRPAIITNYTAQRVIPTAQVMISQLSNQYFDRVQMSSLDLGTPVSVLWKTNDEKWYFVRSALTFGWVEAEYIAFCTDDELKLWESETNFGITTQSRSSIYADNTVKTFLTWIPMGSKLFFDMDAGLADGYMAVIIPTRDDTGWLKRVTGYIKHNEIYIGYMPYTQRTILTQAFEMLHSPYGWGGMYGEQDCSGYLIRIFNCVGIVLPRNSRQQAAVGDTVYTTGIYNALSPRQAIIFFGIAGASFIQMPGHIMLYVGSISGEPYVIHAMWAFTQEDNRLQVPARVVLSDLMLGKGSDRGMYQDRVLRVSNILSPTGSK